MKGWTPQAVEQAAKPSFVAPERTARPTQGKTQPAGREASTDEITPPIKTPTAYHVGPYRLDVANGTHFPDRMRAALVGPSDGKLIEVLVEAMKQYCNQPT